MKKKILCFGLVLLASCLFANNQEKTTSAEKLLRSLPKRDQENIKRLSIVLNVNKTVNQFRSDNIKHPENNHSKYFSSITGLKWKIMQRESNFTPIFWSDFFAGTTLLNGPYNERNAVVALYNVWWDAILCFRLEAVSNGSQWKISSFEFKSGEDFRREKNSEIPSFDSVIARKGQQALVWMQLIKKTRACFNSYFPTDDPANYKYSNTFIASSKLPVQLRAAARMKLYQQILKNKGVVVEMSSFLQLLRGVKAEKMKEIFKGEDFETFSLFASLPDGFRKTMTFYGYWGTEQQRLYLYISRVNSNIVCLLYINVGIQVNFEMFDLNDSEKYLDAIDAAQARKAENK